MTKYISRVIKVVVLPESDPIFSALATTIEIDDEGAGEYVRITQPTREENGSVCFDRNEWESIKPEIDRMIKECQNKDD